ncbi:MAG: hypothetical protein KGL04_07600 [Elusimicrobia bacterium]|nr:hypothetical protein [Elusimicrobiota bacterium]MDE2314022.1 hypothetical protein [Elusimicrobiota bacterium]
MQKTVRLWAALACFAALAACGAANQKIVVQDFADGSVTDLSITEQITGENDFLFFSIPQKTRFLDGYIKGQITDYSGSPIQGVIVRAVASSGETTNPEDELFGESIGGSSGGNNATTSFDPGVSDTNGFYRIRFVLPIINNIVDVRGRLVFNPGWQQEKTNLGKAYQPQTKESQFHLYYDYKKGRLIYVQGIQRTIVAPALSGLPPKMGGLPGSAPPPPAKPAASAQSQSSGGDQDLFKGFGFGP